VKIGHFAQRLQVCLQRHGGHLEHILKTTFMQSGFNEWNFGE